MKKNRLGRLEARRRRGREAGRKAILLLLAVVVAVGMVYLAVTWSRGNAEGMEPMERIWLPVVLVECRGESCTGDGEPVPWPIVCGKDYWGPECE